MNNTQLLINKMSKNSKNVRYSDLCKVCDHYFGEARQSKTSHRFYKTPWMGLPKVNIQNNKGEAKAYQVSQVLKAIKKMEQLK